MSATLRSLLAVERGRSRGLLVAASASSAAAGAASVLLLGLSGWFIVGCGVFGGGVAAFNYMLPSAAIRMLTIIRTGARHAERLTGHDAALGALARVRPLLFRALAAAPPATSLAMTTGEATTRLVGDIGAIEAQIVRAPALYGAWAAWASGAVLLAWACGVAGLALAAFPLAIWAAVWLLAYRHERLGRAEPAASGELHREFAHLASALPELKAYDLGAWAAERLHRRGKTLAAAQHAAIECWSDPLLAAAPGVAAVLALCAASDAALPMAGLAALAAMAAVEGIAGHARLLRRQGQVRMAEARLDEVLATAPDSISARPLVPGSFPIEFPQLGVRLAPGSFAGVQGPSGCGKTRLLESVMRLHDDDARTVWIGDHAVGDYDRNEIRARFAYAAQDAPVLSGTVRENLLLGDPLASEAAICRALRDAALADRVLSLPQGLDTWLGEDGMRLSGGERRRLCLARAYLRPAAWLLLDEPTEGLDQETEARVIDGLRRRVAETGQGVVVVSHRPALLAACGMVFSAAATSSELTAGQPKPGCARPGMRRPTRRTKQASPNGKTA